MPTDLLLDVVYAHKADTLALADAVNPVEQGQRTRMALFDAWLNEPLPRRDMWGDPENPEVAAGMEAMMAMMGAPTGGN